MKCTVVLRMPFLHLVQNNSVVKEPLCSTTLAECADTLLLTFAGTGISREGPTNRSFTFFFSPRIDSLLFITLCRHFLPRPIFQWQFFVGVIILRLCNLLAAFLDIMSDSLYAPASKIFVQPQYNTQNTIQYNTTQQH